MWTQKVKTFAQPITKVLCMYHEGKVGLKCVSGVSENDDEEVFLADFEDFEKSSLSPVRFSEK